MKSVVLTGIALLTLSTATGCSSAVKPDIGGDASDLTSISLTIPDKSEFTSDKSLQEKLESYKFVAKVDDNNSLKPSDCQLTDPSKADGKSYSTSGAWSSATKLSLTVKQGCSYDFVVDLGRLASSKNATSKDDQMYFEGSYHLSKEEIGHLAKLQISITVKVTDLGKTAGFDGSVQTPAGDTDVSVKINPPAKEPAANAGGTSTPSTGSEANAGTSSTAAKPSYPTADVAKQLEAICGTSGAILSRDQLAGTSTALNVIIGSAVSPSQRPDLYWVKESSGYKVVEITLDPKGAAQPVISAVKEPDANTHAGVLCLYYDSSDPSFYVGWMGRLVTQSVNTF